MCNYIIRVEYYRLNIKLERIFLYIRFALNSGVRFIKFKAIGHAPLITPIESLSFLSNGARCIINHFNII